MYSKNVLSFLTLGLLSLAKINGEVTDKCNDIYSYFESKFKESSIKSCSVNAEGEVTELSFSSYCLEDKQLETILSYNTIESLNLLGIPLDYEDFFENDERDSYTCPSISTYYERISEMNNLKKLKIGRMKLTQEMIDVISKFTNLESLNLYETTITEELNFDKFKNLKNLTSLEMSNEVDDLLGVQENLLKNLVSLKKLRIINCSFKMNSIETIGNISTLEELAISVPYIEYGANFNALGNLKNLSSLELYCLWHSGSAFDISDAIFNLTSLKRLINSDCSLIVPAYRSHTLANLKNLEYLYVFKSRESGNGNLFEIKDLGKLPTSIKEIYLDQYNEDEYLQDAIPKNIENLKNLEVLDIRSSSIISIPKSFGNLENLRVLNLNGNCISSLPEEFGNLKNLEELGMAYNRLKSLPKSIGNLTNLKILDMSNNEISSIPASIGNLTKLEELDLTNNEITKVPSSLQNLKNIKIIKLDISLSDNYTDDDEPTDNFELYDDIEPTSDIEPTFDIEPSEYVEPTDVVEPSDIIDIPTEPEPSEEILQYHQQCLEELKPYAICNDLSAKISHKKEVIKEEADPLCNSYEEANCKEFYKSVFTYAPSCEKTFDLDIFDYMDYIYLYDLHWNYSGSNLYCAKKSTGEYCNLHGEVNKLFYDEHYKMNISAACGEDECRESLIDYFDALIEEDYYGVGELENYQNKIKFLQSDQCVKNKY